MIISHKPFQNIANNESGNDSLTEELHICFVIHNETIDVKRQQTKQAQY